MVVSDRDLEDRPNTMSKRKYHPVKALMFSVDQYCSGM